MKVSRYFQLLAVRWQLGALLIGTSELEQLHWFILGRTDVYRKATLFDLCGHKTSLIARCLNRMWSLLLHWNLEGRWRLLQFLGVATVESEYMGYSRSILLRVGASLVQRLEVKLADRPYK